jgi:hypothetical protein
MLSTRLSARAQATSFQGRAATISGGQTASPHRTWIQGHRNQRGLLDAFFSAIEPKESLVFFYAKRTLCSTTINGSSRGAVKVTSIGDLREWDYEPGSEGAAGRGASWTRSPRS